MALKNKSKKAPKVKNPKPGALLKPEHVDEGTAIATGAAAAAIALFNPIAGVIAAGLAPFVANRLNDLYTTRAKAIGKSLESLDVNIEDAVSKGSDAHLKTDVLREFLQAGVETSSAEKVRLMLHILEFGLAADARVDVLFARRVLRTVARIDELEMMILATLTGKHSDMKGVTLQDLARSSPISDVNVLRSGLSVLQSEGLIAAIDDVFKVTDYGATLLGELKASSKRALPPPS